MTPEDLNARLDTMAAEANGDPARMPGLITVQTDDWIARIATIDRPRPRTIADGIRIRDIKVAVSSTAETKVLTRAEAGEAGEPYRDLTAAT
ncbi:hypothetical protein E4M02_06110 [Brevundimonas sp. S30B]|uniref:hypothetical protein n=1 Tax=unclassified Brevundimonas TaxID=2622653 RepID=UPI0010720E77|nr:MULTISPECIES: hypothetical protein [unclassified Brevundimonas]QBX38071.1 hypothetical protein E4M01_10030 [Brevundimonas sp. MF30-B]TFW02575.1 hypothetical protein E4M02_06110 [Brevundimonas sp. S30B]